MSEKHIGGNKSAALLLIGNELLSGKVREANLYPLAQMLFRRGVKLRRVVCCEDVIDVIASEVRELSERFDYVFTSGGIGPTHDDVTVQAVGQGLGVRVVRDEAIAAKVRAHHESKGRKINDAHLRLADVFEGGRLLRLPDQRFPTLAVKNVYVLPGVPVIFEMMLGAIEADLQSEATLHSLEYWTELDEGTIAADLIAIEAEFPEVSVGSYPHYDGQSYRVKLTFDSSDASAVERARAALIARLADHAPG